APIMGYLWDFSPGGGVNGQVIQHTFPWPGYHFFCLNFSANGCYANACEEVYVDNDGNVFLVNSGCEADFEMTQATDGNGDPIPFELDLTNLSTGTGTITYSWQLPLGETSTDF